MLIVFSCRLRREAERIKKEEERLKREEADRAKRESERLRKEEEKRKQREAEERKQKAREEKERLEREKKEKEEKLRRERDERMRKEKEAKEREECEREAREREAKERVDKERVEVEAKEQEAKAKALALEREELETQQANQAQLAQQQGIHQIAAASTSSSTSSPSILTNQMSMGQHLPVPSMQSSLSMQYPPVQLSGLLYQNFQSNPNLRQPTMQMHQSQSVMLNPGPFSSQHNAIHQLPSPTTTVPAMLSQPSFLQHQLSQQSPQHSLSTLPFPTLQSPSDLPTSDMFNTGGGLSGLRWAPPGIAGPNDLSSGQMAGSGSSAVNSTPSPPTISAQPAPLDSSTATKSATSNTVPPGIGAGRNASIANGGKAISRPAPIGRPHFSGSGSSTHSVNPFNYEDGYAGVFGFFGTGAATNPSDALPSTFEPDEQFAALALGADLFKDAWLEPSSNSLSGPASGSSSYPQMGGGGGGMGSGMGIGMGGAGIVGQSRFVGAGAPQQQSQNQPSHLGAGAFGGFLGFQPSSQDSLLGVSPGSRGLFDHMGMWGDAPGLGSMGGVGLGGGMGGLVGDLGTPISAAGGSSGNGPSNDMVSGFGFPRSGSMNYLVPGAGVGAGAPGLGDGSHQDLKDSLRQPPGLPYKSWYPAC
jgi:hypothetical protein